jgi:hypothetical protein
VQPETYSLSVEASGFHKSVVQNVTLVVAQEARANVALKAGAIAESVTLEANAVALDTDTATASETVALPHAQPASAADPENEVCWFRRAQMQRELHNPPEQEKALGECRRLHDIKNRQKEWNQYRLRTNRLNE